MLLSYVSCIHPKAVLPAQYHPVAGVLCHLREESRFPIRPDRSKSCIRAEVETQCRNSGTFRLYDREISLSQSKDCAIDSGSNVCIAVREPFAIVIPSACINVLTYLDHFSMVTRMLPVVESFFKRPSGLSGQSICALFCRLQKCNGGRVSSCEKSTPSEDAYICSDRYWIKLLPVEDCPGCRAPAQDGA
jgi:hypothetical protein